MFSTLHTAPDRGWAAAGTAAAGTAGAGWRTVTLESVVALRICSQKRKETRVENALSDSETSPQNLRVVWIVSHTNWPHYPLVGI
jgi:hypothetical protein